MQSSFKKSSQNAKNLTGIPLIDQILGDNEKGSMILIKEDEYSRIHNILLNTFVSEGVANNEQNILIIGESDINMVVYEVNRLENVESDVKKMFIAWRYSDLKLEQSSYKFSLSFKGNYNGQKILTQSVNEILSKLKEVKNHRVAIYSLFSPSYDDVDLEKMLFEIRKVVRENEHICMISMPTFLHDNVHFDLFFDNVFSLNSNLLTGLLPNYRATIEIEKISAYKNIRQINLESFIFGIKFMKDKLVVEKIDIPPDESENTINCTAF